MKHKILDKFLSKKSAKTDLTGQIIIGTILLSTIMSLFAFYPISLYINPEVYIKSNPYINIDNLRLKSIGPRQIIGKEKLGFNTLEVSWPVWSDCGPVLIEINQYRMLNREIYIWMWGRSSLCPQVAAWENYLIEIFIPFHGSWEIFCNGKPITIFI